jgi:putative transposase
MASGVLPSGPPLIERPRTHTVVNNPLPEACTVCGEPGPQVSYFYLAGLVVRLHASCDARLGRWSGCRSRGVSSRRACALLSVARSTLTYRSRRAVRDRPVLTAMRALAAQYPRDGYRRIRIFLARQGHAMSADRTHRLWRAAGLQVPRKRPRRRVAASRPRPRPPQGRNHVWAYDFVFDHCANGQRLKCLTVVDEFTRECLAIDVAGSIRSPRVIEVLAQLVSVTGPRRTCARTTGRSLSRLPSCAGCTARRSKRR